MAMDFMKAVKDFGDKITINLFEMKTTILFIFSILTSFALNAQAESPKQFHVEYKLYHIRWKNDSTNSSKIPVVKADFTKLSEVLPLYASDKMKYGIQFEVYESKINNETRYFLNIAYYYWADSKWVLTIVNDGLSFELTEKPDIDIYDDSGPDSAWTSDFGVKYRCSIITK
jgi:hypothetical protein